MMKLIIRYFFLVAWMFGISRGLQGEVFQKINNASHLQSILRKNPFVILKFSSEHCGACKRMEPVDTYVAKHYEGTSFQKFFWKVLRRPHIIFCSIDVDKHREIAHRYGIHGVPTYLFMKRGHLEARVDEPLSKEKFEEKVKKLLSE